jgi:hypothetical protein
MKPRFRIVALFAAMLLARSVFAATFVVPPDRDLVRRADAIVVAVPLSSFAEESEEGGIETVTSFRLEDVLKGRDIGMSFTVVEPGGEYHGRAQLISGVPRFTTNERVLLFLARTARDRWVVSEIALGKFSMRSEEGRLLALRDAGEINGWDPDLTPHRERARDAERFLQFIRDESRGLQPKDDYFVSGPPAGPSARILAAPATEIAPFSATSYTMFVSGSMGSRWAVFPNGITFFSGTTQEPGAPGGGTTAINAAFTAWNNDCLSNVNYVYGGTDNGTHTQGLHGVDGANTILFERDLSSFGIAPFTCSGNSYSGTLGIGGITSASGTNSVSGETFATTQEGDVEMNRGIANCTLLFNNGDWNSAVTHEVGHTLGFRHADQTRDSSAACSTDPSLECSTNAIMKSFISTGLNATLQTWDQHAVQAVYPGNVCAPGGPPTCTPPSITSQPQSTNVVAGGTTTLAVAATGTAPLSYQWFIGSSGNTANPIAGATGPSVQVTPASTTTYWVRVSNSCGSVNSASATVTVSQPPPATKARAYDLNGDTRADIFWWQTQTGDTAVWLMNGTTKSSSAVVENSPLVWRPAGVGDFDGDGKADILWRNTSTGENAIWFMNGLVKRSGVIIEGAPLIWTVVGVGDFNGDGRDDILWRNNSTGDNAMWLMNGATKSVGAIIEWAPSFWSVVGVGDFNGDGKADILWRNNSTGENAMWLMNGTTKAVGAIIESAPPFWQVVGIGDFNGDGKADILWRANDSSGSDAMWLMNGTTKATGAIIEGAPANWKVVEVGDFNGDGMADILWRDPSNGSNAMWLMSGTTKSVGAIIESAPPAWSVVR